jgi:hypothetical protein
MTKRLAICYSGQPRLNAHAWFNFKAHILKPFHMEGFKMDFFVHFWSIVTPPTRGTDLWRPYRWRHDSQKNVSRNPKDFLQYFLDETSPVGLWIEGPLNEEDYSLKPFANELSKIPPQYLYGYNSQYESVAKVHDMCREAEIAGDFKYDYVIRMRSDLNVLTPLNYEECSPDYICVPAFPGHQNFWTEEELQVFQASPDFEKEVKRIAAEQKTTEEVILQRMHESTQFDATQRCNDQLAISSSDNMYKYSRLLDFIIKCYQDKYPCVVKKFIEPPPQHGFSLTETGHIVQAEEPMGLEKMLWMHISNFSQIKKLDLPTRIETHYP